MSIRYCKFLIEEDTMPCCAGEFWGLNTSRDGNRGLIEASNGLDLILGRDNWPKPACSLVLSEAVQIKQFGQLFPP
jgi:hypothetical protein